MVEKCSLPALLHEVWRSGGYYQMEINEVAKGKGRGGEGDLRVAKVE